MKKTKVIIPALGMLLLSTAASVTGTVAWFAMNSSVTANNMSITATTDSTYLVISKTSDITANTASVNLAQPSGSVLPTTWQKDGENVYHWVSAAGTSTSNGAASGGYTNLTIAEASNFGSVTATSKNYYVYDSVFVGLAVGSSTPSTKKLVCDVTFTATSASNYNKCLTVGLDAEANMGTASDFDEKYVYGIGTATAQTRTSTTQLIAGSALSTTAKEIKIYAFFDGDDAACTTANAIDLAGISISMEFKLVDLA